uniref:Bone marrow stromal cell antigen 2 n=1 Tax=Callithrix jacchus TaxID=9483 RepID=A0A5F4VSG4_CALJA
MAPTLFHYSLVPMDDFLKHESKERCKLPVGTGVVVLLVIVAVALGVLLIVYVKKANSEACQEGHRAVMECRNVTHLLEQELTRAQDGFRDAEAQIATYNQTVEEKPGLKRENRGPEELRQLPEGHQLRGGASAPDSAAGPQRSAPLRSREAGAASKGRFPLSFSLGQSRDLIGSGRVMGQQVWRGHGAVLGVGTQSCLPPEPGRE